MKLLRILSATSKFIVLFCLSALVFLFGSCSGSEQHDANSKMSIEKLSLLEQKGESFADYTVKEELKIQGGVDLGIIKDTIFVKVQLNRGSLSPEDPLVLEAKTPSIRFIELFQKSENGDYVSLGKKGTSMIGEFSLIESNFSPAFEVDRLGSGDFIFKIYSHEPLVVDISTYKKRDFASYNANRSILFNIYIGIMLALFLYNLILYFSVSDKVYLVYCLYTLFITLAQLSLAGYSSLVIFKSNYALYESSIVLFSGMSGLFAVMFIRIFLKTPRIIPVLDKVLLLIGGIYLIVLVSRLFSFIEISYRLTDLAGMLVAIFFFWSGVLTAKKGYRPAIYFLIAWSFFLIGVVLFVLKNLGIAVFPELASFPMLIGTALEAILLSLALANRINILKKEKEQEQQKTFHALKENERLIKEQNVILEEKVKLRTEELEKTLNNLQNTQTQLVNQEKMASLGQLTAGIAHEINNPINFVSSNVSPLKRDIKDIIEIVDAYREKGKSEFSKESLEDLQELEEDLEFDYLIEEIGLLLKGMEDGAKRTVEIVKGLRLFSRVDEQDVKKVDLHDGINSTLVLLNSTMGKIEIRKEYGNIPMVECLAGKINQVFMNIISNAIQALGEQGSENPAPEILIKTISQNGNVILEIGDNGPGMPEHVRERIFEPFFTTKAVGKGTGLGLSIVYKIIENHKGTLDVITEPGKGSKFVIKLPVYQKTPKNEQ
ncbi:7TM diverse intracellular signaling domain-containing protein [Echinicola salinicaeni]|uniref:7TM diverse intracellular signaling domain-containing protein n=1 Tax=Echinicola salinicaeni TaxID=2762757 RepID=UPI001E5C73E6|nr:7TM diverse intracellular signaling domain-containing protein [Echinicola salinicaeni]